MLFAVTIPLDLTPTGVGSRGGFGAGQGVAAVGRGPLGVPGSLTRWPCSCGR